MLPDVHVAALCHVRSRLVDGSESGGPERLQTCLGLRGKASWSGSCDYHERPADLELRWLRVCRSAGVFSNPLWGGSTKTLLHGDWQGPSEPSHPARLLAARRRHDIVLEFLRPGSCNQRPADHPHSRAIHRSSLWGDAVAAETTGPAQTLQDLALSFALRLSASGLAVHVCLRRLAVYLAWVGHARPGRRGFSSLVPASQK